MKITKRVLAVLSVVVLVAILGFILFTCGWKVYQDLTAPVVYDTSVDLRLYEDSGTPEELVELLDHGGIERGEKVLGQIESIYRDRDRTWPELRAEIWPEIQAEIESYHLSEGRYLPRNQEEFLETAAWIRHNVIAWRAFRERLRTRYEIYLREPEALVGLRWG